MQTQFFHGARVVTGAPNPPAIASVSSSVIGLLCTGANSQVAVAAQLQVGVAGSNAELIFTAATAGALGNQISISLIDPAADSVDLAISVKARAISVTLATDETGALTTTGAQLATAIAGNAGAHALVTVAEAEGSTGAGIVAPTTALFLSGGMDEAFPVDTPVLVTDDILQAASLIGTEGTGAQSLTDIAMVTQGTGATVIVVRVASSNVDNVQTTNLVGGIDNQDAYHGAQAFLGAEATTGLRPMILIAPGFSSETSVAGALLQVANKLRAHVVIEGPNTTDAAAVAYGKKFADRRGYLVDPALLVNDATGATIIAPNSAAVAALISAIDNDPAKGPHWSPSNQVLPGVFGTARPVPYMQGDANCRANYLNGQNVATVIRRNGFRLWGNRTLSADARFVFLSVSRMDDVIALSIEQVANAWAVDHPIDENYFPDVCEEIRAYFAELVGKGAIVGGDVFPTPGKNTPQQIAQGQVSFSYRWSPAYPAENVEIIDGVTDVFLSNLTAAKNQ